MKVDLENVEAILLEKKVEPIKIQEILKDLTQAAEEEKQDRAAEAGPKAKWEHVIVLNDPEGKLTAMKDDFMGWVVQQREGQDSGLVLSKLADAAKVQNEQSKRKKNIIKNFIELFEGLKAKWTKEKGVRIKTKDLVRVLVINGKTM
jgi:hypothetical protein